MGDQDINLRGLPAPQFTPPPLPTPPAGAIEASAPVSFAVTARPPATEQYPYPQWLGILRIVAAFAVSAISDATSAAAQFVPPVQIAVDLVTALLLWMLLGWRWVMLPAFVAEAIPGLAMFPTWLLVTTACVVSPKAKSRKQ